MVASNSLNISESGVVTFDGVSIFKGRTMTAGSGISIINGNGIAGNPIISSSVNPAGNRVLIESKTASASTSISFVSGVSGYDLYEIDVYGVTTSGNDGAKTLHMQLSTNAGSSWVTAASYSAAGTGFDSGGGGGGFFQAGATSYLVSNNVSDSATFPFTCTIKLFGLASTSLYKNIQYTSTANFNNCYSVSASGTLQNTSAMNGIKIFPAAGNFALGTFKLYGIL